LEPSRDRLTSRPFYRGQVDALSRCRFPGETGDYGAVTVAWILTLAKKEHAALLSTGGSDNIQQIVRSAGVKDLYAAPESRQCPRSVEKSDHKHR
jgi:hypothetical protein